MGYKGYVTDEFSQLDLEHHLSHGPGQKIEIGPDPHHEKWYVLEKEEHGLDELGFYIIFTLKDSDGTISEYPIRGIKNFEYELYEEHLKYWLGISDEPHRKTPIGNTEPFTAQTGDRTQRFRLMVRWDEITDNAEEARRLGFKGVPSSNS